MEIPDISFGIITDIQYADTPNGLNYTGDKVRYFRNSVFILGDAVKHWNTAPGQINFVLQLGDIIDGCNASTSGASRKSLEKITQIFSQLKCPVYHVTGNHELYNFKRELLKDTKIQSSYLSPGVTSDPRGKNYYTFSPIGGFRVIVLDTFDTSLLGVDTDSSEYEQTLELFRQYNQNEDMNDSSGKWMR